MKKFITQFFAILVFSSVCHVPHLAAEVYGGGHWEAIGLGNMPCSEFTKKTKEESYRELGAVWLSGFMFVRFYVRSEFYI